MPEGPEVKVVVDKIQKYLSSQLIFDKIEIIENVPTKRHRFSNHPIKDLEKVKKFKIVSVESYGKVIFFVLKSNEDYFFIVNTLGMSGSWFWNGRNHKHAHLNFLGKENLTFIDTRNFGTFKIIDYATYIKKKLSIGYDLLKRPAPKEIWINFQNHKSICNLPLGEALLKQHLFSGIGNIYKSEILYECYLDPRMKVNQISKKRWELINLIAHSVLQKAYEAGGTTIRDFEANGEKGRNQFQLEIYGKQEVLEGKVKKIVQNGRTTYYCPQRIK